MQGCQHLSEVLGKWRREFDPLSTCGEGKAEPGGVKKQARARKTTATRPIHRIAHYRMPDVRQVNSDLVRPTCYRTSFDQSTRLGKSRAPSQELTHSIPCFGHTALLHHRYALSIVGVSAERYFHRSFAGVQSAVNQGQIDFFDPSLPELSLQGDAGNLVPGNHDQPRSVPVQPMHDPGAQPILCCQIDHSAKLGVPSKQRIDKRVLSMTCSRMNDQPGRFVHNHAVGILVYDVQGQIQRHELSGQYFRARNAYDVSWHQPVARFGWHAVHIYAPFANPPLNLGPGDVHELLGDKRVQALTRLCDIRVRSLQTHSPTLESRTPRHPRTPIK